ncbi:MAG: hypothetical protein Q9N68_01505 [Gammaproteobacteria bacterium]|nr:hypothetical protein [Gammaproteobacteria bacterium]
MKNFKIAVATAALALASGYAHATLATSTSTSNEDTASTTAQYKLSKALIISSMGTLDFPDLVLPTPTNTTTSIQVFNDDTVLYGTGSSPNGNTTSSAGNTGSSNTYSANAGTVTVAGEPNYQFNLGFVITQPTNTNLALVITPTDIGDIALDAAGDKVVNFGGTLTATYSSSAPVMSGTGSIVLAATVSYN